MSLKKFDRMNFNYLKEKMRDNWERYCSDQNQTRGIKPLRLDNKDNHSNAYFWVGVLHHTVLCDYTSTLPDTARHLWEERDRNNLRMKKTNLVIAHLNTYEGIIAQLLFKGIKISEEVRALILMSSMPPSWETFVTVVYNASFTRMTYAFVTCSIHSEDACRKTFVQTTSCEAYVVQGTSGQQHRQWGTGHSNL